MALVNTAKPSSPSYTNTAKVASFETWATISTTWATETRTWLDMSSFMDNGTKVSASITNVSKPS